MKPKRVDTMRLTDQHFGTNSTNTPESTSSHTQTAPQCQLGLPLGVGPKAEEIYSFAQNAHARGLTRPERKRNDWKWVSLLRKRRSHSVPWFGEAEGQQGIYGEGPPHGDEETREVKLFPGRWCSPQDRQSPDCMHMIQHLHVEADAGDEDRWR